MKHVLAISNSLERKLLPDYSLLLQTSIGSANLIESPSIELLFLLSPEALSHPSAPRPQISFFHSNLFLLIPPSSPPNLPTSSSNIILTPALSREMPVPLRSDSAADERGQRPGVDRAGDRVHQHRGEDHQGESGAHQAGD